MGKRLVAQRRGGGSPTYRANTHRAKTDARYVITGKDKKVTGVLADIEHDPVRNAPVALIKFDNNDKRHMIVSEGTYVGKKVECGPGAEVSYGNILPLSEVPEGTPVFNVELAPGDGGRLVRSSGMAAIVTSHSMTNTVVKLPSKRFKTLDSKCRATIGVVAGGERKIKPFAKASNKLYNRKARGKLYPITSRNAMNAVDHPFGGSNMGVSKTSGRNASPGSKVGSIAAKRTGKKR